ncbi:F-box protein [Forsythia ovata]|uniref:F-box protein n=1 Tax=Forsythia ovata TaxID=205694 RepID=A0ABD1X7L7_9LAMI
MDVCDDVLLEILARLPPKVVFKFRCVSKRWNKIINSPFFLRSYGERRKGSFAGSLLGFMHGFMQNKTRYTYTCGNPHLPSKPPIRILPLLGDQIFTVPSKLGYFISASNGLVLCGHQPMTYYVMNLLTKKWVSLPSPHSAYEVKSIELVCEESTTQLVANYKVVRTCIPSDLEVDNKLTIQTYSSKTGKWAESILVATSNPLSLCDPPIVLNGVFHWSVFEKYIAVYDSNDIGRENHLQMIKNPPAERMLVSSVFSRSSDGLLWCGYYTGLSMQIWTLPKGENGYKRSCNIPAKDWSLVHTVTLDSLCNDYSALSYLREELKNGHLDLYMLALIPWNPLIVVFRIDETIFLYNAESKSMETVRLRYHDQPTIVPFDDYWHPYFESPFLSSYALQ